MSAEAMAWAKDQDLPMVEKFLLVLVADAASPQGTAALSGEELAAQAGCARSTALANLKKLEGRELLRREPSWRADGGAERSVIQLPLGPRWGVREPDTPRPGAGHPPVREPDGPRGRKTAGSSSTSNDQGPRGTALLAFSLEEDPDPDMVLDAETFLRTKLKVAGKLVTPEEMRKAVVAMTAFNREAGTAQSLGPNVTPIVGRVREHPSWDAAALERLVESAFRLRWWEKNGRQRPGPPTPKVIFGSTDCFVNVANDAADEKRGRTERIEERREKYDRSVVRDA